MDEMDKLDKNDLVDTDNSNEVKVVSASRSNKNLKDLPITIEVITKEEIRRNGYITLVDVLKHIQGMRVSQPGSGLEGETFLMRGLVGNYYSKILLNSIPLQPSTTASLAIAEQLPIAQAERIELIFGPASSIYGADAMAGVVNIITQNNQQYHYAQGTLVGDDFNHRHLNFMLGGKFGKDKNVVRYSLYGNYSTKPDLNITTDSVLHSPLNYIDFYPLQEQTLADPEAFTAIVKNIFPFYEGTGLKPSIREKPQNAYLMGFQLNYRDWTFSFNEMYRQTHSSIGTHPLIEAFFGDKMQRATVSYQKNGEHLGFTSNLSYNRYRFNPNSARASNYTGFDGISYKYAASDDIFAEMLFRYISPKDWEWTIGVSGQLSGILPTTNDLNEPFEESHYKAFSTKSLPSHELYGDFGLNPLRYFNIGVLAQVFKSTPKWTYILGYRFDRNTVYSIDEMPAGEVRASVQYNASRKLSFRLSLGSAIKAPAPSDAYVSLALPDGVYPDSINYQQIPNPDVQPELLAAFELGSRYQISPKLSLETILFAHDITNKIERLLVPIDRNEYPKSIAENTNFGSNLLARTVLNDENTQALLVALQLILRGKNLIPRIKLNTDISLTFSSGEEILSSEQNNIKIDGYRMMPNFIGHFNLDFQLRKKFYLRFENILASSYYRYFYVSEEVIPNYNNKAKGYYTLDAVFRYEVSKQLSSYVRIINLGNSKYGGIAATGYDVDLPHNPQYLRTIQVGMNFNL